MTALTKIKRFAIAFPVLIADLACAILAPGERDDSSSDDADDVDTVNTVGPINPTTGLPMIGGFDTDGNAYGTFSTRR